MGTGVTEEDVAALPPWERKYMHYTEVPAFLKHEFNISVTVGTVYRWIKEGLAWGTNRRYLACKYLAGRRLFVQRADVIAFLEAQ
jgi:hypothetical protein